MGHPIPRKYFIRIRRQLLELWAKFFELPQSCIGKSSVNMPVSASWSLITASRSNQLVAQSTSSKTSQNFVHNFFSYSGGQTDKQRQKHNLLCGGNNIGLGLWVMIQYLRLYENITERFSVTPRAECLRMILIILRYTVHLHRGSKKYATTIFTITLSSVNNFLIILSLLSSENELWRKSETSFTHATE